MEPAQTSPDGVTTFGTNGIPEFTIVPLLQPQAGLNSIVLLAQLPADLPVVIVPQVDTSIESSFPFTIAPDPARPGGVILSSDLVAAINFPYVLTPPPGLAGPLALVIVPQEAKAGVPLLIVPQGSPLSVPPTPVPAPTPEPAPSSGGRSAPGPRFLPGATPAPGGSPLGIIVPPRQAYASLVVDQGPLHRVALIVKRLVSAAGTRPR
jgi:hypothetical protein